MKERDIFNSAFSYDMDSGVLVWRDNSGSRGVAGNQAGWIDQKGYLSVGCNGGIYRVHRVAWIMCFGEIPKSVQVDHVNGIKTDNRICNLRLVSPADNQKNMSRSKSNSSGITGVSWDKATGMWRAKIHVNRKSICLGRYKNIEDAEKARLLANVKYGFHINHGRRP